MTVPVSYWVVLLGVLLMVSFVGYVLLRKSAFRVMAQVPEEDFIRRVAMKYPDLSSEEIAAARRELARDLGVPRAKLDPAQDIRQFGEKRFWGAAFPQEVLADLEAVIKKGFLPPGDLPTRVDDVISAFVYLKRNKNARRARNG